MWQKLVEEHKLFHQEGFVLKALGLIDPDTVDSRLRHRLKRMQYHSDGPTHVWHLDGYDKLKPFGYCIHE